MVWLENVGSNAKPVFAKPRYLLTRDGEPIEFGWHTAAPKVADWSSTIAKSISRNERTRWGHDLIYDDVELHNIAEVHRVPGQAGVRPQRVPEAVRASLNERAQARMLSPAGAEIRFVSESEATRVTLSCPDGAADVVVFHGGFQSTERHALGAKPQEIEVSTPEMLGQLDPDLVPDMPFAPQVCRLMLSGDPVHLHGIEGSGVRPPHPSEFPRLRYLAYGTSITHGYSATAAHLSYVGQTARRLGVDLINLGVGGAAFCEPELADYIAARRDWDFATLALSCNMMSDRFPPDRFYDRVSYMVNTVAGADPSRPVACITLYPRFQDLLARRFLVTEEGQRKPGIYRQKLRDAVANCPHPNVHLLEGPSILDDPTGLTPDLIHPADNGMIVMGENLARCMRALIGKLQGRAC